MAKGFAFGSDAKDCWKLDLNVKEGSVTIFFGDNPMGVMAIPKMPIMKGRTITRP